MIDLIFTASQLMCDSDFSFAFARQCEAHSSIFHIVRFVFFLFRSLFAHEKPFIINVCAFILRYHYKNTNKFAYKRRLNTLKCSWIFPAFGSKVTKETYAIELIQIPHCKYACKLFSGDYFVVGAFMAVTL